MRIGLAYNEKPDPAPDAASDSASDAFAEWDDPSTIAAVEQALGLFGSVIRLEADQFFPQNLVLARPDLVFNMAEGLHGQSREALVPAICEYLNIPYTGSDPLTLALSLHKGRTKETLAYRGVPTAPFTCIEAPGQIERMADLPRVRQAGRGGIRKGCVRQQLVRQRYGAAGARPVSARALCRARAGRDVPPGPRVHRRDPRERPGGLLPAGDRIRFLGPARGRAAGVRLRGEVGVGPTRSAARDLRVPGTRAGGAVPRDRAHRARGLPRARMPRLVPGRPSGGPVRRAERPRAESSARHHSRSGHELLFPQGGARGRVRLRRAHPGSGPHRLAPADGTGADGRRGDPPRGTGPAAGGGGA